MLFVEAATLGFGGQRMNERRMIRAAWALPAVLALAGATAAWAAADPAAPEDPFEKLNRHSYESNQKFDHAVLRPLAFGYAHIVPKPLRLGIRNFKRNLGEPKTFVNDVLQLRIAKAGRTLVRFTANSTVGIGGLFDPAKRIGLPRDSDDFGLTLARYGVTNGPYLYLPLLGPSTLRDAIGTGVDHVLNPVSLVHFRHKTEILWGVRVGDALEQRVEGDNTLIQLNEQNADPYAATRSVYLQNRAAKLRGRVSLSNLPDIDDPAPPLRGPVAPTEPQGQAPR